MGIVEFTNDDLKKMAKEGLFTNRNLAIELLEMRDKIKNLEEQLKAADELASKIDDIYHDPRCSRFTYADGQCDCDYIELIKLRDKYKTLRAKASSEGRG